MKPKGLRVLGLCALLLTGCASAPETNRAVDRLKPATAEALHAKRKLIVGSWYGEAMTNEGQTRRWLRENHAEGTYKLTIRDYQKDETFQQQVEVGQWGISGNTYFTIMKGWQDGGNFRSVNPANPYYYDAYQILKLTPEAWTYQHAETGLKFSVKRVAEDFTLPGKQPEPEAPPPETKPAKPAKPAKPKAKAKAATKAKAKKPATSKKK